MQELITQVDWSSMFSFSLRIFAVLICIMVHELSHGLAAYLLGDPTAKDYHRLSLNPIRHIDPLGLLMMVAVGFGWAKPVPVDPSHFKNPKSGMAITAFAGPLSNFVLAFLTAMAFQALYVMVAIQGETPFRFELLNFLGLLIALNIGLGIFNLIPFPPLDGSKILGFILPERLYFSLMRYEHYGMLILMALLWLGFLDAPLFFLCSGMTELLFSSTSFVRTAMMMLLG